MENIHPMTIHFTIALFLVAVLFEILGKFMSKPDLRIVGHWNLLLAFFSAGVSVITGLKAESVVPHSGQVHEMMEKHELLGITVLIIIFLMNVYNLFLKKRLSPKFESLYFALAIAGVIAISVGSYFGGEMVFRYGVGVQEIVTEEESGGHDHGEHGH